MRIYIAVFVAVAGAAAGLGAQGAGPDREIVAARDTVWRAWFTNDTMLLHRFIPNAAATADGSAQLRWNDRREIFDGARAFTSTKARFVDVRFDHTEIQHAGRTALVRSNYQVVTESGAHRDTTRGRATELFVKDGATWLNPYWQLEPNAKGAVREIPLPDTLGANFAIADSAANKATLDDYDRLVGTWEFQYQGRAPDGTFQPPFRGHWTFEKKPGGGLVEDRWRVDNPTTQMGNSLYTYRTFDPRRHVWFMLGASSNGGAVEPGLTWADTTSLYAIQRNGIALSRIRYTWLSPDHFLWRSDSSLDGGKTWSLDSGTMEARRIGK